eukprot:g2764.t1
MHSLSTNLEHALNMVLREMPEDPLSALADIFETQSIGSKGVTAAKVHRTVDPLGCSAIRIELATSLGKFSAQVTMRTEANGEQSFLSAPLPEKTLLNKSRRKKKKKMTEEEEMKRTDDLKRILKKTEDRERNEKEKIDRVVAFLEQKIFPKIIGNNPTDRSVIDTILQSALQDEIERLKEEQRQVEAAESGEEMKRAAGDSEDNVEATKEDGTRSDEPKKREIKDTDLPLIALLRRACFAASVATWRAAAESGGKELYECILEKCRGDDELYVPVPAITIVSGGNVSRNAFPFRGIELIPVGAVSFEDAVQMGLDVRSALIRRLEEKSIYWSTSIDGAIELFGVVDVPGILNAINDAVAAAGHMDKIKLGISADAANAFVPPTKEDLESETNVGGTYNLGYKLRNANSTHTYSCDQLTEMYRKAIAENGVIVLEDPFETESWERYAELTEEFGQDVQILASRAMNTPVTAPVIHRAANEMAFNGALLHLDTTATVSAALEVARQIRKKGWGLAVSTVLRDTSDPFVADIAFGLKARQVRFGGLSHSSLMEKYSRVISIERHIVGSAEYAGSRFAIS